MKHLYELEIGVIINLNGNRKVYADTICSELEYESEIKSIQSGTYNNWQTLVNIFDTYEKETFFTKHKYITILDENYNYHDVYKEDFIDFIVECKIIEYPKDGKLTLDYLKRNLSFDKYVELLKDLIPDKSQLELMNLLLS